MSRTVAAVAFLVVLLLVSAREARAQDTPSLVGFSGALPASIFTSAVETTKGSLPEQHRVSPLLQSLYITTIVVQGLDAHSTFKALDAGAIEVNPLVGPIASHRPAFIALKAAVSISTIYTARGLSENHKVFASLALIGINSAYVALVARNYRIAREMSARR